MCLAGRHQGNGKPENTGKQLRRAVAKALTLNKGTNWVEVLPPVVRAWHETTGPSGYTPNEIVFGKHNRTKGPPLAEPDGNRNVFRQPHGTSKLEVWRNYELGDDDMVHGWLAGAPWDASRPNLEARVHGDGISSDYVWISSATKPRANLNSRYWCQVVPSTAAFRNLRNEIQQG